MTGGLHPVFSTGRGGAGNIVASKKEVSAADEVVVSDSDFQKNLNKSFKHDKDGQAIVSSGRGGAGNITKAANVPTPKVSETDFKNDLSPIFSTGRGGAGNIVSKSSNKIRHSKSRGQEMDDQISPITSRKSQNNGNSLTAVSGHQDEKPGLMKKIKKLFH